MGKVVGFVVSPSEIEGRIEALDAAIVSLDADVVASRAPRLNDKWRTAWGEFRRRWQLERDTWADWDSRLFATRVMPRLSDFQAAYLRWARQYQERTGKTATIPAPLEGAPSPVDSLVTWIGIGIVLYFVLKGSDR